MGSRPAGPSAPVLMQQMVRATGTEVAMATLPDPVIAEMAGLCAACPRTDACRQWLMRPQDSGDRPPADLCPNHITFASLRGDATLP